MQAYNPADLAKAQRFSQTKENLAYANLSGANLSDLNLAGANLYRANLEQSTLLRTNLTGASLQDANFRWACLDQADLTRAQIIRTNFEYAHFVKAKIVNVNAENASFYDACLEDAIVQRCVFRDCNMSLVKLTVNAKIGVVAFNYCNVDKLQLWANKVEATIMYRCRGDYSDIKDWMKQKERANRDLGYDDLDRYIDSLLDIYTYDLEPES